MRASTVMILAVFLAAVGRWANNQPTANVKLIVEAAFATFIIALLDQGRTEPIAKGFAWLFFMAVILSNNSPLTGIEKATSTGGSIA